MAESPITRAAIAKGCEPRTAPAPVGLYEAFFEVALDTLRKGTPGLTDVTRATLARSIAMKCQHAAKQQERAA